MATVTSYMSGCRRGKVPCLGDHQDLILRNIPVKVFVDSDIIYGTVDSFNPSRNTYNLQVANSSELLTLNIGEDHIFYAGQPTVTLPDAYDAALVIGGELYTVMKPVAGLPTFWIGSSMCFYYPEDIQMIIQLHKGQYTEIG